MAAKGQFVHRPVRNGAAFSADNGVSTSTFCRGTASAATLVRLPREYGSTLAVMATKALSYFGTRNGLLETLLALSET